VSVPDAHLPENRLEGSRRFSSVGDLDGLIGDGFSSGPQVALVVRENFFGGGDEYLAGGLTGAALITRQFPKQARAGGIYPERIGGVIAAEVGRDQASSSSGAGNGKEAEGKYFFHR